MGQTIVEKIALAYMTEGPSRPLRAGDFVSIKPRHIMTHDNTSAVIKKFKSIGAKRVFNHQQPVFALDHDIQNQSEDNLKKYAAIEAFAREHHIDFYPAGTGIGHQIMMERGYVVPGSFVVASDSHSNMYGALGAIGTPVVRTDAAAIWATGEFWWQIPRTVQVELKGELQKGVSGKDVIIALCGLYNKEEVLNAAVEFRGHGVASLSMDARMSIANMTTEWGALVGWFPCDQATIAYMRQVRDRLKAEGNQRVTDDDIEHWVCCALRPDVDATYSSYITLDLSEVTPHVSGPDTVQVMASLAEIQPKKIPVNKAYLISCVNSRLEDLEAAARVLEGKKISPSVKFYLGAASKTVQAEAERRGVWKTIVDAGAIALPPSCGPCIGLGTGLLESGEIGISATNRNFKGRMGAKDAQCYLASPEVVAASAVAGYITTGNGTAAKPLTRDYALADLPEVAPEKVSIIQGFPERVKGRLVFLPKDNLNTDGIYAGAYTYREDMTTEMMAKVIFDNYDASLPSRVQKGDVVVGGFNFGTGSSREQAVTALKAAGIPLVIAGSFSQTYLRNAFNNGFLCIEVPELVKKLKAVFTGTEKSFIPGDEIEVDFTSGTVTFRGTKYTFPAMGSVPQRLVVAGGVENLVSKRLGISK
ncbi:MAG TPA: homoaconitase [Terriglobales bacterium]|nr:homoaconitase [Terriglobales bacterium]